MTSATVPTVDERIQVVADQVRARCGDFIRERVNPGAADRDSSDRPIDRSLLEEAARIGLYGMLLPTELGGKGGDTLVHGATLEQVGYLCEDLSFPLLLGVFERIAEEAWLSGRPEIIERYAGPMARGEMFGSFAYTDGTDPFSFRSTATRSGSGYVLNADKPLVTGAELADVFMTYLREESGDLMVCFVERSDPGVTVLPVPVTGNRAAGIGRLVLDDVHVGAERVLVSSDGLSHAQRFLNSRRVLHACAPLGRMQAILERCVDHLAGTVRYEQPLTEFANVQAALGRMLVLVETARAVTHRALERASHADAHFDPIHSVAKYTVVEASIELSTIAMRLLGGAGYVRANGYERHFRDFLGLISGAGTQDILEIDLGVMAASQRDLSNGTSQRSST